MSSSKPAHKGLSALPVPVRRALQQIGREISSARLLRGWSQQDLAARLDVSVSTVRRMEDGYHGTALHTFLRALHVLGRLDAVVELLTIEQDSLGMELVRENLPKRAGKTRSQPEPQAVAKGSQVTTPKDELKGF